MSGPRLPRRAETSANDRVTTDPALTVPILGERVERREDPPLLTGEAKFLADLDSTGALHAAFVRSAVPHGIIASIETSAALSAPGVVAVLAAADLDLGDLPEWPRAEGPPRPELGRPCLAGERVRFVGEAVAVVLAESEALAVDAAEQVVVEIEALPAVIDPMAALEPGAPLLFPGIETNVVLETTPADEHDVLADAEVVVRASFVNRRVAPVPLEPNGAFVRPLEDGTLECHLSTQTPFGCRAGLARALGRDESEVWVRTPAVGGGFGAKGGLYPEQVVVAAAAALLGRAVRYVETRSENLVAMSHGRGQHQEVALGALRDGRIVGLEARTVTDMGAYCWRGAIPYATSRLMSTGVYRIPLVKLTSLGVVTNTSPIGPYRGAGRPEAATMLERAVELLADALGMDSVELRRKNLLRPSDFPYTTPTGASYDSGDYESVLDAVLEHAGYADLRARQALLRSKSAARQLGIGLSTFVEISGSGPEYGSVALEADGTLVVTTGSSPHGQGHETTLGQIVGALFNVPAHRVRLVHSDTRAVPHGVGTFGSRSGQLGGSAVHNAGLVVLERSRRAAARLLEAAEEDVVAGVGGSFAVAGVPSRSVSLADVAAALPPEELQSGADFVQPQGTYPFGAHLAVVEVDTSTGGVRLCRFVAVDDCGRVINPAIVEGQVHGGLAQGIAQALYEEFVYDDRGNPLTTTLADYEMPSAAELPSFETHETVTFSPRNPLGMKGVGESGAVGAAAAVLNAVIDALSPYGVRDLDMPLTPEKVWRASSGSTGARRGRRPD